MTGPDLRLRREVAGVQAIAIAGRMSCNPSTISRLERRQSVGDEVARRYLDAVDAEAQERERDRRQLARELIRCGTAALAAAR